MSTRSSRRMVWMLAVVSSLSCSFGSAATPAVDNSKCGIFLAPSSIPGSGVGMYVGHRPFAKGETVTLGDAVIPISEFDWNTEHFNPSYRFLWDEYTWNAYVFPGMEEETEESKYDMQAASPGVGSAANSYLSLANVEDTYITLGRSVASDSPGLGATTIYYDREFFATADIPAGGEIFVDYGRNYFVSRSHTYGYLPLPETYGSSDRLVRKYLAIKKRISRSLKHSALQNDLFVDAWDTVTSFATIWKTSRVLNGLPKKEDILGTVLESGGTAMQDFNQSIKDLTWLEENGQCMDNIKVGQSDNPDAGRAARANRFIPKGGLVAPTPLIHVPDDEVMKMYHPIEDNYHLNRVTPDSEGPHTYQLLYNYCFGHQQSTLLLCPYGLLTAWINHSADKPNTRVQWSQEMRHKDWLEKKIEVWGNQYHTGLQMDFVALRDIEEDEEILIDYGAAWEEAWQEHVRNYAPRPETYQPAFEMNEMMDLQYRTMDERPYEADGVELWCRSFYIERFAPSEDDDAQCRIVKKLENDKYMVELYHVDDDDDYRQTSHVRDPVLFSVPRDAFYFVDMTFWRDHHMFSAFRHAMMIPDDMFPEIWKNVKGSV